MEVKPVKAWARVHIDSRGIDEQAIYWDRSELRSNFKLTPTDRIIPVLITLITKRAARKPAKKGRGKCLRNT